MPRRPSDLPTEPEPVQARAAIVHDHAQSIGLTRDGIAATTMADVLTQAPETVLGYLDGEPAQVYVTPATTALGEAVGRRLNRLGVPTTIVREQTDRERLP